MEHVYAQERLTDNLVKELEPLVTFHHAEVSTFKDMDVCPAWDKYLAMDNAGMLRIYTVRGEGKLIGYAFFILGPHLHYRYSVQAVEDALYIQPEHRGYGKHFMVWCDNQLRECGAQVIYRGVPTTNDYSRILLILGYKPLEQMYSRRF